MEIIVFLSIVIAVVAVLTSIVLVRRVKKQIAEMTDVLVDVKNGIRVDEFSLGLGPTLLGKQIGETKFSLKLLPFGGAGFIPVSFSKGFRRF